MKDMPIGKLLELVKTGSAMVKYEVVTKHTTLWTSDESPFVTIVDTACITHIEHQALADAIRERCQG